MCGIAAVIDNVNVPSLPDWQFWGGNKQHSSIEDEPIHLESLLLPLERRGPDEKSIKEVKLHSDISIKMCSTLLSMRDANFQPAHVMKEDVLLYNGEIYDGFTPDANTANKETFNSFVSDGVLFFNHLNSTLEKYGQVQPEHLDRFRGPWAFIYWHHKSRRLYFGRDVLGRRSLMIKVRLGKSIVITSVPPRGGCEGFIEIPPNGIGYIDLSSTHSPHFGLFARRCVNVLPKRAQSSDECNLLAGSGLHMYVSFLPEQWHRGFKPRPPPIPIEETKLSKKETVNKFLHLFRKAMRRRLVTKQQKAEGDSRYAVLFSGGIDSMFLSAILLECIASNEQIDLINVAFGADATKIAQCPDRQSAISGYKELKTLAKAGQRINLICVNIRPEEADEVLAKHISDLVYPCDQPMDATIGTAIWLAARGQGVIYNETSQNVMKQVKSTARVLFNGLGADELMGGYKGRHRTIFRHEGEEGIRREMDADMSRLWFRNLGRDDRLISDHGREVRHPFLDEDVIQFVTTLPVSEHVCDLSLPDGVGDKHLLRRAASIVGLSADSVSRVKRAIQFGSRSKHVIERKRKNI